jgi:hypothetical protein
LAVGACGFAVLYAAGSELAEEGKAEIYQGKLRAKPTLRTVML